MTDSTLISNGVKYCQYCLPSQRRRHWDLHVDYYLDKFRFVFFPAKSNPDWLWGKILLVLSWFGLVKFEKNPPEAEILNRSLIIFKEARTRGIDIEAIRILGRLKNEYRYRVPSANRRSRWQYFEGVPFADQSDNRLVDSKARFKRLMRDNHVPVAEGRMFTSPRLASFYGKSLGFPLVVKPVTGSLGYHSVYNINSAAELETAIMIARQFRPDFMVERHVSGDNFRATVVGKKHIFVCGKDRANVVGDGVSTVEKLIDEKNKHPWRGVHGQKNTTLHQIQKSHPQFKADLNYVPQPGQKVYFFDDFIPGSGIDFINLDDVHADNKALFVKAAKLLDADLVGFDIIARDLTKPYREQNLVFLEANTLPYVDMHQFPSHGKPVNIAKIIWDTVLEK